MQILIVTSQFLLKGHKVLNSLFAFFLKISETLKAHISGTVKTFLLGFKPSFILANKKFIENFDA